MGQCYFALKIYITIIAAITERGAASPSSKSEISRCNFLQKGKTVSSLSSLVSGSTIVLIVTVMLKITGLLFYFTFIFKTSIIVLAAQNEARASFALQMPYSKYV